MKINKPLHCCLFCGRDTTSDYEICGRCAPIFKRQSVTTSPKEEQRGRSVLSMHILMGPDETNYGSQDEIPPIRFELMREKHIDIEDFW